MAKKLPFAIFLLLFFLVTKPFFAQQSYYSDVDLNLTGVTLKNALAVKIINTHTNALDYTPGIWEASRATDVNPANSSEVLLIYGYSTTGTTSRTRGINDNGGSNGEWNREHVYANSLGNPDLDAAGTNGPPYADAHNLRPSDTQINSSRGNKRFATGSGNSGAVTDGWYPGDEWKGDVARIIMYMYLRYGDQCKPTQVGVGDSSATPDDMIDLFLQWNAEDPVSDIERQRNTFHENTSNTYAQGNRNPFIDNPRLATRIWGGPNAEDIWGIYSSSDTEAPTVPTNLMASNITTSSIDVSWTAATDNVAVTSYDVFVDGNLSTNTTSTSITLDNLNSNTTYSITVLAKDAVGNESAQTTAITPKTLEDTEAPTTPSNVVVSNETDTTFKVTWTASTDNTAVTVYEIYISGNLDGTSTNTEYTATGLVASTTYSVRILAKDAVGNTSPLSTPVSGATTDGGTSSANELFFSEYVEGSSNNKALEIANVTSSPVNLSGYSIRRNGNGGSSWSAPLNLSGTIASGDVYVIINGSAGLQKLIDEADLVHPNSSATNNGEPINFNGNDPIGLFKNDVLIDIIGVFNGGSGNFAKDRTLRRKLTVVNPNTTFDLVNEWEEFARDNVENIGVHNTATASINDEVLNQIKAYPNPAVNGIIKIQNGGNAIINKVSVFSIEGKEVYTTTKNLNQNTILIENIETGIYFLKINSDFGNKLQKILVK
ncbi:endonuclease [uncultured Tenacibaculum sp.]|uniref:endonuclease n=1 Tax=uncultured Tenacibaculum sp. TaxID=174713 RepID=UPI0026058520|nr:endonuclease [uncultured Tenacibaculum sp.]